MDSQWLTILLGSHDISSSIFHFTQHSTFDFNVLNLIQSFKGLDLLTGHYVFPDTINSFCIDNITGDVWVSTVKDILVLSPNMKNIQHIFSGYDTGNIFGVSRQNNNAYMFSGQLVSIFHAKHQSRIRSFWVNIFCVYSVALIESIQQIVFLSRNGETLQFYSFEGQHVRDFNGHQLPLIRNVGESIFVHPNTNDLWVVNHSKQTFYPTVMVWDVITDPSHQPTLKGIHVIKTTFSEIDCFFNSWIQQMIAYNTRSFHDVGPLVIGFDMNELNPPISFAEIRPLITNVNDRRVTHLFPHPHRYHNPHHPYFFSYFQRLPQFQCHPLLRCLIGKTNNSLIVMDL